MRFNLDINGKTTSFEVWGPTQMTDPTEPSHSRTTIPPTDTQPERHIGHMDQLQMEKKTLSSLHMAMTRFLKCAVCSLFSICKEELLKGGLLNKEENTRNNTTNTQNTLLKEPQKKEYQIRSLYETFKVCRVLVILLPFDSEGEFPEMDNTPFPNVLPWFGHCASLTLQQVGPVFLGCRPFALSV